MSKEMEELRRKLRGCIGGDGDTEFPAVGTEVNEEEFTCTVRRDDQVDYYDVRLRGLAHSSSREASGLRMWTRSMPASSSSRIVAASRGTACGGVMTTIRIILRRRPG